MKKALLVILLLQTTLFAQKSITESFINGDIKKIEKWLTKNPDGEIKTLEKEISVLWENGYLASSSCFAESMNILELSVIFKFNSLTNKLLKMSSIGGKSENLTNAISKAIAADDLDLVKKLWKLGGKLNTNCIYCHNRSNIQLAFGNECSKEMIDFLIENNAEMDFDHVDCTGMTLLHMIANYPDHSYLEKYYPQSEKHLNKRSIDGDTPFQLAFLSGHKKNALFLWSRMTENQKIDVLNNGGKDDIINVPFNYYVKSNESDIKLLDSLSNEIKYDFEKTVDSDELEDLGYFYQEFYFDQSFLAKTQAIYDVYNEVLGLDLKMDNTLLKKNQTIDFHAILFYKDLALNSFLIKKTLEANPTGFKSQIEDYKEMMEFDRDFFNFGADTLNLGISELENVEDEYDYILYQLSYFYPFINTIYYELDYAENLDKLKMIHSINYSNLILRFVGGEDSYSAENFPKIFEYETIRILGAETFIFPDAEKSRLKTVFVPKGNKVVNLPINVDVVYFE